MKERAKEVRPPRKGAKAKVDDEAALLAKIAEMPAPDRILGERLHALVKANAPDLKPKLWYGMPGWARNGKVVCFYQSAEKFKSRYATFGFNEDARLDDGTMWPTAFALTELSTEDETRLGELLKRA